MISRKVLSSFLSSDFDPLHGEVRYICDYCHRKVGESRSALEIHTALAHMPPSSASMELRRNLELGHP